MREQSENKPGTGTDDGAKVLIRADIALAVFAGACFGTALRFALSAIPALNAFHVGTFMANMLACFLYGALTACLSGLTNMPLHKKELANRGCGMGFCGGFSTLSAFALEELTGVRSFDIVGVLGYGAATFICGLSMAYLGAKLGTCVAHAVQRENKAGA